jgi:probable HAF family extracellular repeat protein
MPIASVRHCCGSTTLAVGILLGVAACGETPVTAPENPAADGARGSTGGSGGPRVSATDPDTGFRGTTINVQVLGSGFDQGSKAMWALNGDTTFVTTKIRTNSTQYVSSKKLIANITIGGDAPLDLYDVIVLTAGGKKGIGLELFAVTYKVTDLGTLGGTWSDALAINGLGHVVGMSHTASGEVHAFLWTPETGMRDLAATGSGRSEAHGVNASGQVVGYGWGSGSFRAFIWTAAEGMRNLELFGGASSFGMSINDDGDVGGEISGLPGQSIRSAVIWTAGGYELVDGVNFSGMGVVDLRGLTQAVGTAETADRVNVPKPFLYTRTAGGWTATAILPISSSDADARALNAAGQVTGYFRRTDGGISSYVWSASAGFDTLPSLGGRVDSYDLNDAGVVVGSVVGSAWAHEKAAMWIPLDDGSWGLQLLPSDNRRGVARAINNRGDIAGVIYTSSGQHAAIWTLK